MTRTLLLLCIITASFAETAEPQIARGVARWVDSARVANLPYDVLLQKVHEGESKGASVGEIETAVARLFHNLQSARSVLGQVPDGDLIAAADALRYGATPQHLQQLTAVREAEGFSNAVVTFSFMVQTGVPAATAISLVTPLLAADLPPAKFVTLQRDIERDLRAGANPTTAARTRTSALTREIAPNNTKRRIPR